VTLFVFEPIDELSERKLVSTNGLIVMVTRFAFLNPLLMVTAGIIVAAFARGSSLAATVGVGIVYGLLIWLAGAVHSLGHVLSSRIAGGPVWYVRLSATVMTIQYPAGKVSARVHERARSCVVRAPQVPSAHPSWRFNPSS
jgi:hypothetical protein